MDQYFSPKTGALMILSAMVIFVSPGRAQTLTPEKPVELAGTHGKFDFIKVDAARRRLLACHTQNGSLDVIDLDTSKLIKSVPTGAAQGVAIDAKDGRYFVSTSKPPKLVIVDAAKLEVTGEVALPAPADLVAYHEGTNRVYVCNDEAPQAWVIDPEKKAIVTTLTYPGAGMEDLGFDATGKYLFQNLKDTSAVAQLDVATGQIIATWPTAPAAKPHGMTIVPGGILVAGTGQLVLLDDATGKVKASAAIAQKVDEIAYDPGVGAVYGASGTGVIAVVTMSGDKLASAGAYVPSKAGAHSITVDPRTHAVWIAYGDDATSFVQKFDVSAK